MELDQDSIPPAPSSVDKSMVLNVKPLRALVPVFPSPPNLSSSSTSHGVSPFVSISPPGMAPFHPFFSSMDSQMFFHQNSQNQISRPVPISSFRTPCSTNEDKGNQRVSEMIGCERDGSRSQKKKKKKKGNQDGGSASAYVDEDKLVDDILKSINPLVLDTLKEPNSGKDSVAYTLTIFEVLRRKIAQIEEAKEGDIVVVKRSDLRAGTVMLSKGLRTNKEKRIGTVPGVEVGDIFYFRMELCVVGLHAPSMSGIDYMGVKVSQEDEPLAISIISSGGYEDNVDDGDVLIYSGQGGSCQSKEQCDQKLERGNLALEKSLHRGNEVRVTRGLKESMNSRTKVYVYDGLYKIQESWVEKGKSGFNVFKYKLVRLPGQPEGYMIWKSIKQWTDKSTLRTGLILPDITSGSENLPVCLVNDVDDEKGGPACFTYCHNLKNFKPIHPVEPSTGCNCIGGCLSGNLSCACIQKNGGYLPYSANGVLMDLKSVIYECGRSCQCPPSCRNRVSQGGLKTRLEVFKTMDKGWGLRSWDPIRAGTFICEYAGEVIDNARVEELGGENDDDDYIFDSTRSYEQLEIFPSDTAAPKIPYSLYITARNNGNVARFMNHSCSPNVFWRPIIRTNKDQSDLHVAFHAIRHIPPMTELAYDYGIVQPLTESHKKKECLCGSVKCRGYFC